MRHDDNLRFVFVCNTDRYSSMDALVQFRGSWDVRKLDTFTGDQTDIQSNFTNGWTVFKYKFDGCGSLLVRLEQASRPDTTCPKTTPILSPPSVAGIKINKIKLSEPNVLMLDYAEFKLDDEEWSQRPEEILRIDNTIRETLKIPRRGGAWKQPYSIPPSERRIRATVNLRFKFQSYIGLETKSMLALENLSSTVIHVNGTRIPTEDSDGSWWVDEAIKTVHIPPGTIQAGENIINLALPFGILTNIERVYLLGDFSVHLYQNLAVLESLNLDALTWGDITWQGLPFYVGNVLYDCEFSVPNSSHASTSSVTLSVPDFSSPVLAVHDFKGTKLGNIALQPRTLDLGQLKAGHHAITITAFGNRYNSFGHIHLQDGKTNDCWPDLWRSKYHPYYERIVLTHHSSGRLVDG